MKKPLLLASMAGSALFFVGALVVIVGFIHQAGQKPNTAADAISAAQHYCKTDKHYTQGEYAICYNEYTDVAGLSSQPSPALLQSFDDLCTQVTGAAIVACNDGYTAGYSNLESRLHPAPASKSSSSSTAAKPSSSSSSSKSTSTKSSTSTSSPSKTPTPATTTTTTTTTPSSAPKATPVVAATTTPTPTAPPSESCNDGGVQVSAVWNGIPGVNNGCIGGTVNGQAVNPIYALISIIITFATGVLGLIMILMIVIAGLQYVISNGSPDIVRDAKNRIGNVVTGFIIFVLMWGILQALLPANVSVFK